MQPLLFVRNDPFETFGIAPSAVEDAGAEFRVFEAERGAERPSLEGVAGVVVFGSATNVGEADSHPFIDVVAALVKDAVDDRIPLLGVCFGAQLLASALGASVHASPHREIGFVPLRPATLAASDPVLGHYDDGDPVFQWHMDTFDLPAGAELLAAGDGVANQAFRVGERAWGLQFHFEIDAAEIDLWLDEYEKDGKLEQDWGTSPAEIREQVRANIAAHRTKGREVFRRFVEVARGDRASARIGRAAR